MNPFDGFFTDEIIQAVGDFKSYDGEKREHVEIPDGDYTVRFEAMDYGKTGTGRPKAQFRFRITSGPYAGEALFYHSVFSGNTAQGKAFAFHRFKSIIYGMSVYDDAEGDMMPAFTGPETMDAIKERIDGMEFDFDYSVTLSKDKGGYPVLTVNGIV